MTDQATRRNIILVGFFSIFVKVAFIFALAHPNAANARSAPDSFADLAEKLLPSVVNISTTQKIEQRAPVMRPGPFGDSPSFPGLPENHPFNDMFDNFFDHQFRMMPPMQQQIPATSLGSGFIIDKVRGIIITNSHVIDGADEINVTLHNDTVLPAEVIGVDEKTDLAVIKAELNAEDVSAVTFGDSDEMRVGDWVVAIGNPFGLGGTVTAGIISARQRDINSGPYDDYLQTDASINRGNSGGPMFNIKGEVIGINTAIFSPTGGSVGIGFAIPSALAQPVIGQLIEFGRTRRGWLGVKIQHVTDEIADSLGMNRAVGALVAEVTPNGPAQKAGIQAGDVILAFDGKTIREMRNLPRIVAETDISKDVEILIWRDGRRITMSANIGELEKAEEKGLLATRDGNDLIPEDEGADGTNFDELGLSLKALDESTRQIFSIEPNIDGLVVMDSDPNSDAAKKGIDAGDVILEANQKKIENVDDLRSEIERTKNDERNAILLLINRHGSIQFVAVKLTTDETTEE